MIDKAHEFHAKEAVTIVEVPTSPADEWDEALGQLVADYWQEGLNLCGYSRDSN